MVIVLIVLYHGPRYVGNVDVEVGVFTQQEERNLPNDISTQAGHGTLACCILSWFLMWVASIGWGAPLWYTEYREWQFFGWHALWLGAFLSTFGLMW